MSVPDKQISLYSRFHPDMTGLAFIGLVQPFGAIMPIAEGQGHLVADHLTGTYVLPSREEMQASIDRQEAEVHARYIGSKRHTIQVDFDRYLHALGTERRHGAKRAGVPSSGAHAVS